MTVGAGVKQSLATLKIIEAGLSSLSSSTGDEEAQRLFHEQMLVMEEIKKDLMKQTGTLMIKDGKVLEDSRKKEKYSTDELLQLPKGKDIFNISEVEYAVLEEDGKLSVLLKKDNRPVTRKDLGLKSFNEKEPHTVIIDGEMLDEPLTSIGKNREWLQVELDKKNIALEGVFLG